MLRSKRRRPDRPEPAREGPAARIEALESRELLSSTHVNYYLPTDLPPRIVDHSVRPIHISHPIGNAGPHQLLAAGNEGRVLTGKDRRGDEWYITIHGPGEVIVTDTTPNDGVFDDNLDTIQLVGTSLTDTYVTGQVISSARTESDGTMPFNRLIATSGVKSIVLNGFTLAQTEPGPIADANVLGSGAQIYLPGGVGTLQFHNIDASIARGTNTQQQFNIVIGDPNVPVPVAPVIRLDSIFNTVTSGVAQPSGTPQTTPTVTILVNGQLRSLDIISSTAAAPQAPTLNNDTSSSQFLTDNLTSPVNRTGQTAVRATSVGNLKVLGSAQNFTVSRSGTPFQGGFSGIHRLRSAQFGGNADAVALDVAGPISRLKFAQGLGNPAGTRPSATNFGSPAAQNGFPAAGLSGGTIRADRIGSLTVAPADRILQTRSDPDLIQFDRTGSTSYLTRPGNALTSATIASAGSIGNTKIVGNLQNSEIKAGFHYPSAVAGLEGTRARSSIRPIHVRGDLVDSVISASYRPVDTTYGNANDIAGPGRIRGQFDGVLVQTGSRTALGNVGSGFYAQHKFGYLPPPQNATRVHGVLRR